MLRVWMKPRQTAALYLLGMSLLSPALCRAQSSELEALKATVKGMEQQLQKALSRIEQLEKENAADSAKIGQVEKSVQAAQSSPSILNPAIGLVLDASFDHLGKAGSNFNFRSAELGLSASVDPYARMYGFFTGSNDGVEVEEAAAITTSLPWNLTAKGGRFFADFGRFPKFHPHELPFVNEPLSIERMVGGETQADGAEINYLFPTPFFLRATFGGYNKIGAENEQVDNSKPRSASRFTYLGRLHTYFDLTDNHSIDLGTSLAYTPSVRLVGDPSGGDRILNGVDLTYRYQPLASTLYQGFTWGSEFYTNSQRFPLDDLVAKRQKSYGGYTYGDLKLNRNWSTGFLFDYAPIVDNPRQRTLSYSPYLTWNLSEFNRLRFQYSYLSNNFSADKAENGNQFFVQWTTAIGAHTHGFRGR
ncbi:MAG: hypothetical protein WCH75_26065 [Candidatus Binatia bacterium]